MAQKRMFDKAIIEMERFSDLPMSSKGLYFLLGMEADDEGFVSPKRVMKLYGGNDDDLNVLILKNLIIPFRSGVIVITDWNSNNWLDSRRIKPTKYQEERKLLALNKDKSYLLSNGLASARLEERRIEENRTEENSKENDFSNEKSETQTLEEIKARAFGLKTKLTSN